MTAYRVYDSCHLQADCQELGSALEPYAWYLSMGYLYLFTRKSISKLLKAQNLLAHIVVCLSQFCS